VITEIPSQPSCPASWNPFRVVSLYSMLEVYANSFCRASGIISQFRQQVYCGIQPNEGSFGALGSEMHDLEIQCKTLGLTNTLAQITRVKKSLANDGIPDNLQIFANAVMEVFTRLVDELESRKFYSINSERLTYISGNQFSAVVGQKFPDAIDDMDEAAKCFAFERPTACIFHLMRVTEFGIKAFADLLGIDDHNPTWEPIIRKIDSELKTDYSKRKFKGSQEVLANASTHLHAVKVAWRNKTMHVQKVNTMEHAKEIYDATAGFMRYLAENLPDKKMGIVQSIRGKFGDK
jgi:hypothetical protein